jgi:hypothetical protein
MSNTKKNISNKKSETKTEPSVRGRKKDIIYPILHECSLLVKDEFWQQFYSEMSQAKACKGIFIQNSMIQTSNKRNGFSYCVTNDKHPLVIIKELHKLLLEHTSICSRKDMNKKKQIIKEIEEELEEYDKAKWTSIKRKNIRNILMIDFCILLNKEYCLTWPATIAAYRTIVAAFDSKTHSSKDVVYEDGKITNIEDIEISDDGKEIINNRQDMAPDVESDKSGDNPILLQSLFDSYLTSWSKFSKSS